MEPYGQDSRDETRWSGRGCGESELPAPASLLSAGSEMNPGNSLKPALAPAWVRLATRVFRLLLGIYLLPVVIVIAGITCAFDLIWRCSRVVDVVLNEAAGGMTRRELNSTRQTTMRSRRQRTESHSGGTFHLMN